jgi:hypothetical protein
LAQEWQQWRRGSGESDLVNSLFSDELRMTPLHQEMERVEDRVAISVLRAGLPSGLVSQVGGVLNTAKNWEVFKSRLRGIMEAQLAIVRSGSSRSFRAIQYSSYLLLFLCLILALGSGTRWTDIPGHPLVSLSQLVTGIVSKLFSPSGLAALLSYFLLHLFLGFRFYSRYKKNLQRSRQKFIESLEIALGRAWEDELDATMERLSTFDEEIGARISSISDLYQTRKED